jgi:tetratricopeptide (TPR) repeat protein
MLTPEAAPAKVDRDVRPASAEDDAPGDDVVQQRTEAVEQELASAMKLFDAGNFAEAERALIRLDRKRQRGILPEFLRKKKTPTDATTVDRLLRKSQPAWGEKTLYHLAEAQFQQGKLVAASDTFAKLVVDYPGTRTLEKAVAREFEIAETWLNAINPDAPPEKRGSWTDRFTGRLPAVDVAGHALTVYEHVRHHDPTGPLADDAVMRIADYHDSQGNYEEAAIYYDQLIDELPKSPLLRQAYEKTIQAKLKAYMGPDYNASGLEKARAQIHQAMTLFPERQTSSSEMFSKALDLIDDQDAEITFRRGEFYRQTGYPGAAELCYGEVRARWPRSAWAEQSKSRLDEIALMPRKKVEPSRIMTLPGAGDPYAGGHTPAAGTGTGTPIGSAGAASP